LKNLDSFKKATTKIISALQKEIHILKEKLNKYENPKNSGNSSIPPSQDPNRQTKSLRKKSERPDKIIFHNITACECCQSKLPQEGKIKSRQIFDIPCIKIEE